MFFFLHELAINKIPKFNLSLFYFDKIPYVSGLIFLIYGRIVLSVFSFPTLLARVTYMSHGGGVKRISVTPHSPPPPTGWGRGGGKRVPNFRSSPPVTNT